VSRLSASTAGTREIGLRRAVGASRLAVAFFFMVAVELLAGIIPASGGESGSGRRAALRMIAPPVRCSCYSVSKRSFAASTVGEATPGDRPRGRQGQAISGWAIRGRPYESRGIGQHRGGRGPRTGETERRYGAPHFTDDNDYLWLDAGTIVFKVMTSEWEFYTMDALTGSRKRVATQDGHVADFGVSGPRRFWYKTDDEKMREVTVERAKSRATR